VESISSFSGFNLFATQYKVTFGQLCLTFSTLTWFLMKLLCAYNVFPDIIEIFKILWGLGIGLQLFFKSCRMATDIKSIGIMRKFAKQKFDNQTEGSKAIFDRYNRVVVKTCKFIATLHSVNFVSTVLNPLIGYLLKGEFKLKLDYRYDFLVEWKALDFFINYLFQSMHVFFASFFLRFIR